MSGAGKHAVGNLCAFLRPWVHAEHRGHEHSGESAVGHMHKLVIFPQASPFRISEDTLGGIGRFALAA